MKIKDILQNKPQPITIDVNSTVKDAADILRDKKIGSVVVVDDDHNAVGIITERDMFRILHDDNRIDLTTPLEDAMTKDLIIGLPSDDIDYIAQIITQKRIRHIPILDEDKKLCGIVSIGDILKARLEQARVQVRYLQDYIKGMPTNHIK